MNRRVVLLGAANALSLLAGCTGDPPSDDSTSSGSVTPSASSATPNTASLPTTTAGTKTTDTTDTTRTTDPERTATGTTGGCEEGFAIEARPFDAAEDATVMLDDEHRAIVAEAVENGTVEFSTYGDAPLDGGVFVASDGAFYEIDHMSVFTTVPAYRTSVDWKRGQDAPDDASVVGFADLPESDRMALRVAVSQPGTSDGSDPEKTDEPRFPEESNSFSIGGVPAPYPDGGDRSRLVGNGVTWVSWDGHVLRVELGEAAEAERHTHTYTADEVAGTTAAFEDVVASRYRVELTGLPPDEHAIVERAVREGYQGCGTIAEAVPKLRDRLSDGTALPTSSGDTWYVRFEGEDYRVTMVQWVS